MQTHRRPPPSPEPEYLSALKDAGLTSQFNSDANAIAHGRQVCRQLEEGGPQQGLLADKFAVDAFCPQFSQRFHILETATASGKFVLIDSAGVDAIRGAELARAQPTGGLRPGSDCVVLMRNRTVNSVMCGGGCGTVRQMESLAAQARNQFVSIEKVESF